MILKSTYHLRKQIPEDHGSKMAGKRTQRSPSHIATFSTTIVLLALTMTRTNIVYAISHHLKHSGSSRSVRPVNSNLSWETDSITSDISEKDTLAGRPQYYNRESGSHSNIDNTPIIPMIQRGVFVNQHFILQVHVSIDVSWSDDSDFSFLDSRSDIDQGWNVTIDGVPNHRGSACIESPLHLNQAVIPRWITAAKEKNSRGMSLVSFAVPITSESCRVQTLIVALVQSSSRLKESTILTRRLTNVPEKSDRLSGNRKFNPVVKVELQATTYFLVSSQNSFETSSPWLDLLLCGFVSSAAYILSVLRATMIRDKVNVSSVAKNELFPLDLNCESGLYGRRFNSPTADDTVQQDHDTAIHDADGNTFEFLPLSRNSVSDDDDMSYPSTLEKPPSLVRKGVNPFDINFVPQKQRRLVKLKKKESSFDQRAAYSETDLSVLSPLSQQALEVVSTSPSPSIGVGNTDVTFEAVKTARSKDDPNPVESIGQPLPPRNALNSQRTMQDVSFGSDEETKQANLSIDTQDNRHKPKKEELELAQSANTEAIDHDVDGLDERGTEEHESVTLHHSVVDKATSGGCVTAHNMRCLHERLVEKQGAEVMEQKFTEESTFLSPVATQSIDYVNNDPKDRVDSLDDQDPCCKIVDCEDLSRGDIEFYISRSSRLRTGYSNESSDVVLHAFPSDSSSSKTYRSSLLGRTVNASTQEKKDTPDLETTQSSTIPRRELCLAKEGNRSWLRRLNDRSNLEHLSVKESASILSECGEFTSVDIDQGKHMLSEQLRPSDEKTRRSAFCPILPFDSDCHTSRTRYSKKRISQRNAGDLSSRVDARKPTSDKGDDLLDFVETDSSTELKTAKRGQARKKSKSIMMYKVTHPKPCMSIKGLGALGSPKETRKSLHAHRKHTASFTAESQNRVCIPDRAPSSSLVTVATQILEPVWNFLAEESTMNCGKSRKRKSQVASVTKKFRRSTPNPLKQGSTRSLSTSSIDDDEEEEDDDNDAQREMCRAVGAH